LKEKAIKKSRFSFDKRNNQLWGMVFVSPFWIGTIFILLNMIFTIVKFAFSDVSIANGITTKFLGFDNFDHIFNTDPTFKGYLWGDIKDLLITLPMILIFALFVAVILNSDVPGRTFFRAVFFLPVIVCVGMLSTIDQTNMAMTFMTDTSSTTETAGVVSAIGDITEFLQNLNFSPELISFVSDMANNIMEIMNLSGVQILFYLAGIQSISPQLYEAARVEGASGWEIFWKITLPSIVPTMIVNLIYTLVECLTRDNTQLAAYIKEISINRGYYGHGAAMSVIYFLCIAAILLIIFGAIIFGTKIAARSRREEYR
jgi:ABC-type sugar transport system permease subunit